MVKSCVEPILDGWSLRLLSIGGTFWQWLASYESDSDGNPPEKLTNKLIWLMFRRGNFHCCKVLQVWLPGDKLFSVSNLEMWFKKKQISWAKLNFMFWFSWFCTIPQGKHMIHRPTHHGPRSWAAHGIVPGDCAARAAAAPRWPVSAAFFVVGLCSWNVMGIAITWGSMLENHLSIYIYQ